MTTSSTATSSTTASTSTTSTAARSGAPATEVGDDPAWPVEHVVRHPSAVDTLLDLKAVRYLGPFLHGPRTLSEAAGELRIGTSSLAYWIKKLEAAGLIVRLPSRRRNGMAMPRYRAAGRTLFLPFAAVPPGMTSDLLDGGRRKLLDRFLDGLDEVLRRGGHTGIEFTASGEVGVEIDIREPSDTRGVAPWTDFWGTLRLTREHAEELAVDMKDLVARYRDLEGGRADYVMHIGVAPVSKFKYRSA